MLDFDIVINLMSGKLLISEIAALISSAMSGFHHARNDIVICFYTSLLNTPTVRSGKFIEHYKPNA